MTKENKKILARLNRRKRTTRQRKLKSWATNMRQRSFKKHINPRDVNNPLDDYLKKISLECEIDKELAFALRYYGTGWN